MSVLNTAESKRKQQLVVFVAQDFDDNLRPIVEEHIVRLAASRNWLLGPPRFVNEQSAPPTLGAVLEIYSAIPKGTLDKEVDRLHLQEVNAVVDAMIVLSNEHDLAIEFELDGVFVGAIEDGIMDVSLRDGLLEEWKKHLES